MDIANGGLEHAGNKLGIQKSHEDCLASAQTEEDKAICDEKYQEALDKENERYADEQQSIKEKDKYEAYLCWLLKAWGNPEKEAKKTARSYRNRKDSDYSFDANESISELISDGHKDEVGIQKIKNDLPNYGVSKDKAEQVVKEYYENEYYSKTSEFKIKEPYCYLVGSNVYCNRRMLIDIGLIDEDDGDDDNDDDNDDETEKPDHPDLNNPNPNTPDPGIVNNDYQVEANAISSLVISQYNLNESTLSSEQKRELERVVSFMKKWPNAKITIVGHTCSLGTNAINNIVGLKRAQQAKLYLVKQGINESRIEEISRGATEPCANNNNETGRLQNRRITFIVK